MASSTHDGVVERLLDNVIVGNGPCFSPSGDTLYFSDGRGVILQFDYDPSQGLSAPRPFFDAKSRGTACDGAGAAAIELVVIQFTDWVRSCPEPESDNHIRKIITTQIDNINFGCESNLKSKWIGWSWRDDLAQVLKTKYPKNFVPLYHKGKEYDSMDELIVVDGNWRFDDSSFQHKDKLRICDVIQGVDDTHLSSTGHKVIANSIVRRLK